MKGYLARKKAFLIFKEGETEEGHGHDALLANFTDKGSLEDIRDFLCSKGMAYCRLKPISGGAVVYV